MGLTAAAGPFSNLLLAVLFGIPLRLGLPMPGLASSFLLIMVFVNIGLALFNLIPLPPLDGYSVLQGILGTFRTRWAFDLGRLLDQLAPYGPMLLLGLLSIGWFTRVNVLGFLLGAPRDALVSLILG
jgi:Zn-dependent protease